MKMRVLVFAALLPLVLVAPVSNAAVKAGSACTKQGVKQISGGKSYTCIKTGKKLVWSKGITVKVDPKINETPVVLGSTPTPAKSETPLSNFDRLQGTGSMATSIYSQWTNGLASGTPKTQISYWFGGKVPQEVQIESRRRMDSAVFQWERYFLVKRSKVYFDLGMYDEIEERCEVLKDRSQFFDLQWCLSQAEPEAKRFFYVAAAYESEGGWRPTISPNLSSNASVSHSFNLFSKEVFYTDSFFPRIEHEWFHQIQYDLIGNNTMRELPSWFVEGSAEYFGLLAAASRDKDRFIQIRAQSWYPWNLKYSVAYFKEWIEQNSRTRLAYDKATDSLPADMSTYKTGAVLTEWLVSKIGIDAVIRLLGDVEQMGWLKAFEKHVGKTQTQSIDEMAEYLYREFRIIESNQNWIMLPQCKYYLNDKVIEVTPGRCLSDNGLL